MTFKEQFILNFIENDRWLSLLKGLGVTIQITFFALIIGVVIGIIVAAVRSTYDNNYEALSKKGGFSFILLKLANIICHIYLTIIRGTPVVVQLLISFFIIFVFIIGG